MHIFLFFSFVSLSHVPFRLIRVVKMVNMGPDQALRVPRPILRHNLREVRQGENIKKERCGNGRYKKTRGRGVCREGRGMCAQLGTGTRSKVSPGCSDASPLVACAPSVGHVK